VREIDPEHAQARVNLKHSRERSGVRSVPDEFTPRSRRLHAAAKRIADVATRLPQPTISLCMIVKDEEEMLPGCLEAAAKWVDQVLRRRHGLERPHERDRGRTWCDRN